MELWEQLKGVLGKAAVLIVVCLALFNGLIMLVAPRRWFSLPRYLALRGGMGRPRYLNTAAGRFQVRILGLVLAAFVMCMLWGILGNAGTTDTSLRLGLSHI